MKTSPKTAIKCNFANEVHKILEPNIGIKKSQRWRHLKAYEYTDAQKIELFNKINDLHKESSTLLTSYLNKKRDRKQVQKARIERGYVPKKKTSKEEYMNTVNS